MNDDKWLADIPQNKNGLRIFCLPFAGGGSKAFHGHQEHFSEGAYLVPIQLPGRESRLREAPFHNMQALIEAMTPALYPHLHKPFALFGHSMGAKIAFELALELEKRGFPQPRLVFLSASRAPHIPEPLPIHQYDKKAFINALRRFNATPEAVLQNEELLEVFLPLLRADFTLDETYARKKGECRISCPIHVFYGAQDTEAPKHEVLPWASYTTHSFTATEFAGGHFYFKDQPQAWAQALCTHLNN